MIKDFIAFLYLKYGLLWRKKKLDKTITILEMGIQQFPHYPFLFLHLGLAYQEKGDENKASHYIEKARKLEPSNPIFDLFMGKVLWDQGKYSEALAALEKSVEKDTHNQLAWSYLGLTYLACEEYNKYKEIVAKKGISENQELQIRMILTLENKIRKWNSYELQSFETSE